MSSIINHSNGFVLSDFTSGVIDNLSVADALMPKNAVRKAVNVMFDRPRGAVSQRYGTTKLGGDVETGETILGLFNLRSSNSAYNQALAAANGTIYYLNVATWTSLVTTWNVSAKVRFLTYLDTTAFLNGVNAPQAWTGTGAVQTTGGNLDVGNMPTAKFGAILNGRMFVAGVSTNPCRLYASSIVSADTISWTSGNKTVDIHPNDGSGDISGMAGNGKVIIIFKNRSMFRYDDNSLDKVVDIGSPAPESIINDDNGITYFFGQGANGVGFYRTSGGYPSKMSRPIQKWVEAISPTFYTSVAARTNGRTVSWSIGSVTIDGITYSHASVVYNISDQTWAMENHDDTFVVFCPYIDSTGAMFVLGGDQDGMVQKMDTGTTDNETPIFSECEFGPVVFNDRGRTKKINEIMTYATHFQGLKFHLKVDGGTFEPIGSINSREETYSSMSLIGKTFYPKITAVNSGPPFQFDGFNFIMWDDQGYGG